MPKNAFHEVFEAEGLRMERHGRFMVTQSTRTPEEHRRLQEGLAALHKELPDIIREKVEKLEEIISELDPLDVMANASLANTPFNADTYKEYEFEGNLAHAEFITLICLKRPQWTSENRSTTAPEHGDIIRLVKEIFNAAHALYGTEVADPARTEPPSIVEEMRFLMRINELSVRFPIYEHHLKEQLVSLLAPVDEWMLQELGFSIGDAIALTDGIAALTRRKLVKRVSEGREERKLLRREVRDLRRGRLIEPRHSIEVLSEFARMSEKDMLRGTKNMCASWVFFAVGDTLSFLPNEIATHVGLSTDRVERFLDFFSLGFGGVSDTFYMPSPTHEMQTKPIVRAGDQYLCPSPGGLLCALRPAVEAAMNPTTGSSSTSLAKIWKRYIKNRSRWVERESLKLLEKALMHVDSYSNLKYPSTNGTSQFELDGLILFDRVLILLEAKGGGVPRAARRGAPDSMVDSVEDLVADAHKQALRARAYIERTKHPEFQCDGGKKFVLDKDSFDQILMVTTTLDPLSVFPPIMHRLAKLPIFGPGDLPWTVPVSDLRVICEMVEFPSQLVHYLQRRLRLSELGFIRAHDELDYFGHYLTEGLFFEDLSDMEHGQLQLLSYTTQFDDFYMTEMGQRLKPAPRPRQKMPSDFRRLIQSLEDTHPHGYVPILCALLDTDADTRRMIARHLRKRATAAKKDGKIHDITMLFDDDKRGLTLMCGSRSQGEKLHQRLVMYCATKKYQQRCDSWVGVGCFAEDPTTIVMFVRLDEPWQFDEKVERAEREILPKEAKNILRKK